MGYSTNAYMHHQGNSQNRQQSKPQAKSVSGLAQQVKTLGTKIKKVEKKDAPPIFVYDDYTNDQTAGIQIPFNIGSTPALLKWFQYGAGTSPGNSLLSAGFNEGNIRGNSITVKSFTITGQFYIPVSAINQDYSNIVRMIILWDNDFRNTSTGAYNITPSNAILADYNGTTVSATQPGSYLSRYNVSNVGKGKRFEVLRDHSYALSYGGPNNKRFHIKLRLNRKMGFSDITNGAGKEFQNLLFLFVSDSTAPGYPQGQMHIRLAYSN